MSYGTKFSDNILDDPKYLFVGNNSKFMLINFGRDILKYYNLLLSLILKKSIINKMNNCNYPKLHRIFFFTVFENVLA